MSHEGKLARGEKWEKIRKTAEVLDKPKELEWLKSQPAIQADIKYYLDSLKPEPKEKPKPDKGKGVK